MKDLGLIGRVVLALPIIAFGIIYVAKGIDSMGTNLREWSMVQLLMSVVGIALLFGGVSIIWGKLAKIVCISVAALMLIFVVLLQIPNLIGDSEFVNQTGMISTLKDLGIMGGALVLAAVLSEKKQTKIA